jgi:hypothetical protein
MVGPITNAGPVLLTPGERLIIEFAAGNPSELSLAWSSVTGQPPPPAPFGLAWTAGLSPRDDLTPMSAASLVAPTSPGQYVLIAFSRWPEGDASYGWFVEVQ